MVEKSSETTSDVAIQGEDTRMVEMEIKPEKKKNTLDDEPCADQPLSSRIEALILSSDRPDRWDLLRISGIDDLHSDRSDPGREI